MKKKTLLYEHRNNKYKTAAMDLRCACFSAEIARFRLGRSPCPLQPSRAGRSLPRARAHPYQDAQAEGAPRAGAAPCPRRGALLGCLARAPAHRCLCDPAPTPAQVPPAVVWEPPSGARPPLPRLPLVPLRRLPFCCA